jgi:hypothetical protein
MAARLRLAIMNSEGFGYAARMTSDLVLLTVFRLERGPVRFATSLFHTIHTISMVVYSCISLSKQTLTPAPSCTVVRKAHSS